MKKSIARIPWAWDLRNSLQVGPPRRGAGERPARRSSVRIFVAETQTAELGELAPDPDAPPPGVVPSHPQYEVPDLLADWGSASR